MSDVGKSAVITSPPRTSALPGVIALSGSPGSRHYFSGTPGRMRVLGVVAALMSLAFGLTGIFSLRAVDKAVDRAGANTAQVVRAQALYADLLKADASATNGFLVGGLETTDQRAIYDDAMARVVKNIAEAAKAQPADGTALGALNQHVQAYAGYIAQARAYNRQGLPVGAQYLKLASAGLRADALPVVSAVADANQERADVELGAASNGAPVLWVGILTLMVLGAVGWWLAKRTHRYLNPALVLAVLLVLGGVVLTFGALRGLDQALTAVRDGPYRAAVALASARAEAYDAKSNESLTLIARGSGAKFETAYADSAGLVDAGLREAATASSAQTGLVGGFGPYRTAHAAVRAADDAGNWDEAVALATTSESGSANSAFTTFDTALTAGLNTEVADAQAALDDRSMSWRPWLIGLTGLVAALFGGRAMTKRIEEYR